MTAQEYFTSHEINEQTIKDFSLTWDENTINIPIKDINGKDIFTKSRNLNYPTTQPKYKNSQGSHAVLFNLHTVKEKPNLLLCEGEVDCMRVAQEGIFAISPTSGATTFAKEWGDLLKDKNIWVCYDNDKAGKKGVHTVLEHVPHAKIMTLPKDTKDICDFFTANNTKKDFVQLMRTAQNKQEWKLANIPEEYSLINETELYNMDFTQEPWLIDNILYSEGFCFLYGAEGTGKSYLAMSIAKAVASGTSWLDHFTIPKAKQVLILDKENPLSLLSKRAQGLGTANKNIHYLKYPEKFSLSENGKISEFALSLSSTVKERNIKLIVIDSFVDFMVGNESSAEETQGFFNAVRGLFPKTAFLTIHHENKPSQGTYRNDSQRLRGSSNINAQTFTMFRLEAVAKSKTEMTLKQTKARDMLKLDKFMVRMVVDTLGDGNTVVTGFEYLGEIADIDNSKLSEVKNTIKEMILDLGTVSNKKVLEIGINFGVSGRTVQRGIKELLENGSINEFKKGREKWYAGNVFTNADNNNDYDVL